MCVCVGYSIYLRSQPTFGTLIPSLPRFWTLPLLMGLKMPRLLGVDLTCFGGASFLVFFTHLLLALNYLFSFLFCFWFQQQLSSQQLCPQVFRSASRWRCSQQHRLLNNFFSSYIHTPTLAYICIFTWWGRLPVENKPVVWPIYEFFRLEIRRFSEIFTKLDNVPSHLNV